jgi:hypothetical protein
MPVVICLPLFGPPGRELEEGSALTSGKLRYFAGELAERLQKAADALDRLTAAGWTARVAEFDAILSRPGIQTREDAERLLREAEVPPEDLLIVEDLEEDDEV